MEWFAISYHLNLAPARLKKKKSYELCSYLHIVVIMDYLCKQFINIQLYYLCLHFSAIVFASTIVFWSFCLSSIYGLKQPN